MRLIDADALKEDLEQFYNSDFLCGIESMPLFKQILHDIDNSPTVTPSEIQAIMSNYLVYRKDERPKGKWEKIATYYDDVAHNMYAVFACNICRHGEKIYEYKDTSEYITPNYCSCCGADMKGGAE